MLCFWRIQQASVFECKKAFLLSVSFALNFKELFSLFLILYFLLIEDEFLNRMLNFLPLWTSQRYDALPLLRHVWFPNSPWIAYSCLTNDFKDDSCFFLLRSALHCGGNEGLQTVLLDGYPWAVAFTVPTQLCDAKASWRSRDRHCPIRRFILNQSCVTSRTLNNARHWFKYHFPIPAMSGAWYSG